MIPLIDKKPAYYLAPDILSIILTFILAMLPLGEWNEKLFPIPEAENKLSL